MLKLFDREDGKAADWPLIAETLFAVAFDALDQSPDDPRVLTLLRRVSAGSYDRVAGNPAESSQGMHKAQNQAADLSHPLISKVSMPANKRIWQGAGTF